MLSRDDFQARWIHSKSWLSTEVLKQALQNLSYLDSRNADLCTLLLRQGWLDAQQARAVRAATTEYLAKQFQTAATITDNDPDTEKTTVAKSAATVPYPNLQSGSGSGRHTSPDSQRTAVIKKQNYQPPPQTSNFRANLPAPLPVELQQQYQVISEVNRGSMGAIYKAQHRQSGDVVALKLLLTDHPDPVEKARFQREAETLLRLNHPNIVRLFDVGAYQDFIYFAMDLIEGHDIRSLVSHNLSITSEPMTTDQLLTAMCDIGRALEYCHANDIVHRDVKPQNCVVTINRAVLVDFGLIKRKRSGIPGSSSGGTSTSSSMGLTNPDDVVGTPAYMSPEQLIPGGDFGEVGPASDVWGFGATVFYCLTGLPPFNQATIVEVFQALAHFPAPRIREYVPDVPTWLDQLCADCLQKQASKRPPISEVLQRLEQGLGLHKKPTMERLFEAQKQQVWQLKISLVILTITVIILVVATIINSFR